MSADQPIYIRTDLPAPTWLLGYPEATTLLPTGTAQSLALALVAGTAADALNGDEFGDWRSALSRHYVVWSDDLRLLHAFAVHQPRPIIEAAYFGAVSDAPQTPRLVHGNRIRPVGSLTPTPRDIKLPSRAPSTPSATDGSYSPPLFWEYWGPVSQAVVRSTIPGATLHQCQGIDTPNCRGKMSQRRSLTGAILQDGGPNQVGLAAFSNGGSAVKEFMRHPTDRGRLRATLLLDAIYTTDRRRGKPVPPPEFLAYCQTAKADGHYFWASSSASPNGSFPSGSESLEALAIALNLPPLPKAAVESRLAMPAPVRSWASTSWYVVLLDYGLTYKHAQHATILGPRLARALFLELEV